MRIEKNLIVMTLIFALAFGFAGIGSAYAEEDDASAAVAPDATIVDGPEVMAAGEVSGHPEGTIDAKYCDYHCGLKKIEFLCVPDPLCNCKWLPIAGGGGSCTDDR